MQYSLRILSLHEPMLKLQINNPLIIHQITFVRVQYIERGTSIQKKEKQYNTPFWLAPGFLIQYHALTIRTLGMYMSLQQMIEDQNIKRRVISIFFILFKTVITD